MIRSPVQKITLCWHTGTKRTGRASTSHRYNREEATHDMKRFLATALGVLVLAAATIVGSPPAAEACAGLIGSNGAVNLGRTTTLAAYHNGEEHYVTAFQFLGGGGQFGTLIPLPGVPSKVEKGGAWTLQRLIRETTPVPVALAARDSA